MLAQEPTSLGLRLCPSYPPPVTRFTHLARVVSPRRLSHRWLMGLAALAAIAGWIWPRERASLSGAVQTALTVLLVWAISRELDPDHPASALVVAAIAGGVTLATGATSGSALALAMVTARIVSRSTGLSPLATDLLAIGALAGIVARTPLMWALGMGLAAGVALDTALPHPAPRRSLWLAPAIAVAVTLASFLSDAFSPSWEAPSLPTLILVATGVAAAGSAKYLVRSTDDRSASLDPTRMRAAMWLVVGAAALGTLTGGGTSQEASWPLWAALIGSALSTRLE